jgi:hypothetical protein
MKVLNFEVLEISISSVQMKYYGEILRFLRSTEAMREKSRLDLSMFLKRLH